MRNLHLTFDWYNITSESQKNLTKRSSVLLLHLVRFSTTQTLLSWLVVFEKKAISILAGNLNSGCSYLITAVYLNLDTWSLQDSLQ